MAAATALLAGAVAAGCGFGPGSSSEGRATLMVTRDYGVKQLAAGSDEDPRESDTVIRFLDREASITTRYGGGFVQSINGLAGTSSDGRRSDWFFYINGIESATGAADVRLHGGDRIWWDYRDWTSAMRVPAVVGAWPEPFLQAATPDDRRLPVVIDCAGARAACRTAANRLGQAGVDAGIERFPDRGSSAGALRVLVGPWDAIRTNPAADELDGGPAESGVFARFEPRGGSLALIGLDDHARPVRDVGASAGLVAALRDGDNPPTWVVTGGGPRAVRSAAAKLDAPDLRNRYAIAVAQRRVEPLPVAAKGAG